MSLKETREKIVRFKDDASIVGTPSPGSTATTMSNSSTKKKKVLVVHFQDSVRRIAYTDRMPADAIERSIKRECRIDNGMFSLLDHEGDSIVIDGSMEPGDVWVATDTTFDAKRKNQRTIRAVRPVDTFTANLDNIITENAIQHGFDCVTKKWSQSPMKVKIDVEPFSSGSLRKAYYLQILSEPDEIYVAKISIDPDEDKETYYQDVETQMYAKKYAEAYNLCKPPKKVDFVMASLITFPDRPTQSLWAIEKYISGSYRKHNNNWGYVSDEERNTPQAFSHFTYEISKHKVLICDIQGVADLYTDPQMHTDDSLGVTPGKGNLGTKGFNKFLQTHQCNAICKYLRLTPVNAKSMAMDMGTRPDAPYMTYQHIDVINMELYGAAGNPPSVSDFENERNRVERERLIGASHQYEIQRSRTSTQEKRTCSCIIL